MISEIPSISLRTRQSGAVPSVAITADRRVHLQDLRNSRDVVLNPGSPAAASAQPAHQPHQSDGRPGPGRAGDLAA